MYLFDFVICSNSLHEVNVVSSYGKQSSVSHTDMHLFILGHVDATKCRICDSGRNKHFKVHY